MSRFPMYGVVLSLALVVLANLPAFAQKEVPMPTVLELTQSSSFVFSGTVQERGASTVPAVRPSQKLVTVHVDRALRVDPVLGDVRGKVVTMAAAAPETLHPGQKAVFFTNGWIHGRGIAVREVKHLDVQEEEQVAAAVAQLPQVHLIDRLKSAELVVDAEVASISPVEKRSGARKDALWAAADLRVRSVLYGTATQQARVYFPTADWPPWTNAPRFREGQSGVFLLHAPARDRSLSEAILEAGSLVALDPADFQPESELRRVEELLATIAAERGSR
jgi:hypothetical protein